MKFYWKVTSLIALFIVIFSLNIGTVTAQTVGQRTTIGTKSPVAVGNGQWIPQPGINCGKGWTGNNTPDITTGTPNEVYACCVSSAKNMVIDSLTNWQNDPNNFLGGFIAGVREYPILGHFVNSLMEFGVKVITWKDIAIFGSQGGRGIGSPADFANTLGEVEMCLEGGAPITNADGSNCFCKSGINPALTSITKNCELIKNPNEKKSCFKCLGYDPQTKAYSEGGIWTSIGCIQPDLASFIQVNVFGWGIGLAGLTALGCIIYAAFQLQFAGTNADRVKTTQELLTSCIMGLMVVIFSVFILRIIGVNILQIPGFQ
jgi:hypothetical protein